MQDSDDVKGSTPEVPSEVREAIANYQSRLLSPEQNKRMMPILRNLVLATGPQTVREMKGVMACACRLVADVASPDAVDPLPIIVGPTISRWSIGKLAEGANAGTISNCLSRLNRLDRVNRGLPARVGPSRPPSQPRTVHSGADLLRLATDLAETDLAAAAAVAAAAGAGVYPEAFCGGWFAKQGDDAVLQVKTGSVHVVSAWHALAAQADGVRIDGDAWERARTLARDAGLSLIAHAVHRSWASSVVVEPIPVFELVRRFRISKHSIRVAAELASSFDDEAYERFLRALSDCPTASPQHYLVGSRQRSSSRSDAMPKVSRANAKRIAARARDRARANEPLSPELEHMLQGYAPQGEWPEWTSEVRSAHHSILRMATGLGEKAFRDLCTDVAQLLMFRERNVLPLGRAESMTHPAIDDYYLRGCEGMTDGSRNTRRARLRKFAVKVNPSTDTLPPAKTAGHQAKKPGYVRNEELAIMRVTIHQRNERTRRNLCIVVGCAGGAGLDSVDFRHLRRCHFHDNGDEGIVIDVPGSRARKVVVRREYEPLVRMGLKGLSSNQLVIGVKEDRKNLAARVIHNAEIVGDVPRIEIARLRATWMTALMSRPVPLAVILRAAGIKSARSLIDLLPQIADAGPSADNALRGEVNEK